MHAANAFGRMAISQDHALEKLAANVRAATTTSASDRAKQIFVQAWQVYCSLIGLCLVLSLIRAIPTGLLLTMRLTPTEMSLAKDCTFHTVVSATSMGSRTSTQPLWAKPSVSASQQSKHGA
jgi:hypothetical protein